MHDFFRLFDMNFLDLILAIPLGWLIFKGYRRGLIFEVASLAGIALGSFFAVRFARWFSEWVGFSGQNAFLISFFILFVAVVLLSMALGKLVERFVKLVHVGFLNNLAGAVLGLLKGLCILGVLVYFVAVIDLKERVLTRDTKQSSLLYQPVERMGNRLVGMAGVYLSQRRSLHDQQESEND